MTRFKFILFVLLVVTLLQSFVVGGQANTKEFIPGVKLMPDEFSGSDFFILFSLFGKYDKAELVKGFGPNGEESLKLSSSKYTALRVAYIPRVEPHFKYRISVEYKAEYIVFEDKEYGAYLTVMCGYDLLNIPLKNSNDWTRVETTVNYSKYSPGGLYIYFSLGGFGENQCFSKGEIYFINLKIEKLEELGRYGY